MGIEWIIVDFKSGTESLSIQIIEFDMDRIMRGGPWSFNNQLLLLKRWKKGMIVGNIQMESASLWVQI